MVLAGRRGYDGGPHNSGHYNSAVHEAQFFWSEGGSWDTEYGAFFLDWYSGLLADHANAVLASAAAALHGRDCPRNVRTVKPVLRSFDGLAEVCCTALLTTHTSEPMVPLHHCSLPCSPLPRCKIKKRIEANPTSLSTKLLYLIATNGSVRNS